MGGLGIMDLGMFNHALLMKWMWQWMEPKQRLWKSMFKITNGEQNFYPNAYFFNKILKVTQPMFNISVVRIPGNGNNIQFWIDNWGLGRLCYTYPNLYTYAIDKEASLREVLQSDAIQDCFHGNFSEEAAEEMVNFGRQIALYSVQLSAVEDRIILLWTATEDFTCKSAYQVLMDRPRIDNTIRRIWKLKVPPRFKVFAWLISFNKILTMDNLNKRGWSLTNRCIMCKMQAESVSHLFNKCIITKLLFRLIEIKMNVKIPGGLSNEDEDTIKSLKEFKFSKKERSILLITHFVIWRERCTRTFREEACNLMQLAEQVERQWRYSSTTGD